MNFVAPKKRLSFLKNDLVYDDGHIQIYGTTTFLMFIGDYFMAELIYGKQGLDKYHKGSFKNWISKVKEKDLNKVKKTKKEIEVVLKDCDLIENLWNKGE